ncbi:MAG: LysR family transcriptional regulator [Colwellia sp.]|nr:LysR family transcriptional regulator [Colwellia sp.]
MINQVWLKTFCTLAEVGHFTQTADKLFMTQSGVSQHIKKLEQHLDISLLIRDGKSFSLTDAGNKLYQKGQDLLRSAEELENLIKHDEQYEGKIKVASPGSVGLKLYPYLLEVQQSYPKLIIDYIFAPNKDIEQNLADRKIDLGLMTQLSRISSLVSQKIAVEPLVLVTSNNVKSINWKKLINLGFISHPDAAHHGRLLLSKNFKEFEHIEQFTYKGVSNQISLILEPVSKGFGFTVLPLYAAKAFHHQDLIKIHQLKNSVSESLYLCFNRHSILANRTKFIKATVTDYLG